MLTLLCFQMNQGYLVCCIFLTLITGATIYGVIQVGFNIHQKQRENDRLDELDRLPKTVCRLVVPLNYTIHDGKVYVSTQYRSLDKTYVYSTLMYPVLGSKSEESLRKWLFSLSLEYDCSLYTLNGRTQYVITDIPQADGEKIGNMIFGDIILTFLALCLICVTVAQWNMLCIEECHRKSVQKSSTSEGDSRENEAPEEKMLELPRSSSATMWVEMQS